MKGGSSRQGKNLANSSNANKILVINPHFLVSILMDPLISFSGKFTDDALE